MQNRQQVMFTRAQLELLEKQFPERIATPSTTEAEMRHAAGARLVLQFIKTRVQSQ